MFTILRSKTFSFFMCILLLGTLSFSLISCGEPDVSGSYSGTLSTGSGSADMSMYINQSGGNINGNITVSGSGFESCSFTGTVSSSGSLNFSCGPNTFSGTFSNGTINGTWNDYQNDVSGSFSVSK